MSKKRNRTGKKNIRWTEEKKAYLRQIYEGKTYKEIAELMTEEFKEDFSVTQVNNMLKREKLKTGTINKFQKGHTPWNKGTGKPRKPKTREYTKRQANQAPVGTETLTTDGYINVKVAEPNVWELKHRFLYKKYKGEIPKGYVVIFADKNKNNFELDNLILVSRKQLVVLARHNLVQEDKELTKVAINIADIILKIGERKHGNNK